MRCPSTRAWSRPSARGIYYGRFSEMTDTDFQVLPEENSKSFD